MTHVVVTPGLGTSLQDAGRVGHARLGVPRSGPMDQLHHRLALRLVGQSTQPVPGAVAIEVGPGGVVLRAEQGAVTVAIAGPAVRIVEEGAARMTAVEVLVLPAGRSIEVASGPGAMWIYVAIAGLIATGPVLGSRSQHPRSGLGMGGGAGWELAVGPAAEGIRRGTRAPLRWRTGPFGVLTAPQSHLFAPEILSRLTEGTWRTTSSQDRMGHRLAGPALPCAAGHDIVSDGVLPGSLQVPGDGQVFVLTADHQTTGGYPKIAVLAAAELARFVQLPVGAPIQFAWIEVAEAATRWASAVADVDAVVAGPARPTAASLTDRNLIGGVAEG